MRHTYPVELHQENMPEKVSSYSIGCIKLLIPKPE